MLAASPSAAADRPPSVVVAHAGLQDLQTGIMSHPRVDLTYRAPILINELDASSPAAS
jgi:hypothetical protein